MKQKQKNKLTNKKKQLMKAETKNKANSLGKSFFGVEIPNEWNVVYLGELFDFKNGINAGKESYGSGVKFINVMEVIYNDFITSDLIPGTVQISDEHKKLYLVKDGDVLFNRTSETVEEIGLSAVYNGTDEVVFGGFVIRGRPLNSSIDDFYKRYCLRSSIVRNQIVRNGQGAVRTNIGQGDLSKVLIPLPPLSEQQSIARILKSCDEVIETTEKLIAHKEFRKKWLMQQLLSGKIRLKGSSGEVKLKVIGQFLKEISERNKESKITNVLSVTNSRGFISQSDQFDRSVASEDASNYKIVRKGQFAYNPSRVNVGSLDLLRNFDEGILSPMYVVFTTNEKHLLPDFLYFHLKTQWFYGHIPMFVQGSVRDSLSFDGLCSMKFFIPTIEEQKAILQILQVADKEIYLLKSKADKLRDKKKALMQQLLTGKIRVK
jgi:type I restriction enzyme S subunit